MLNSYVVSHFFNGYVKYLSEYQEGGLEKRTGEDGSPQLEGLYGRALSPDNFARLYDIYFPRLYNYVSYRTRTREDAEDIVAVVFERIINKYHTFNPDKGNLDTWIFTIARNSIITRHRDRVRHLEQTLTAMPDLPSDFSPGEIVLKQEELKRLQHYLEKLNAHEKELIALRFGAGLSHRRIGEMLKMTEGNVAVSLGRIVRKLRQFFENDDIMSGKNKTGSK